MQDPTLQLAALAVLALLIIAAGIWIAIRVSAATPEKRERKRRTSVNRLGRLGDAFITEATNEVIYYEYSVHGVQYTASQEIGLLLDRLPADPERLIGVAHLKYMVNNPANSILLCEEWSGLRAPARPAPTHAAAS